MPYIALLFLLYCFLKSIYYGIYEIQNENKKAGKIFCLLTILAFIFPVTMLIFYYI
jgi:hypothetical protein